MVNYFDVVLIKYFVFVILLVWYHCDICKYVDVDVDQFFCTIIDILFLFLLVFNQMRVAMTQLFGNDNYMDGWVLGLNID